MRKARKSPTEGPKHWSYSIKNNNLYECFPIRCYIVRKTTAGLLSWVDYLVMIYYDDDTILYMSLRTPLYLKHYILLKNAYICNWLSLCHDFMYIFYVLKMEGFLWVRIKRIVDIGIYNFGVRFQVGLHNFQISPIKLSSPIYPIQWIKHEPQHAFMIPSTTNHHYIN